MAFSSADAMGFLLELDDQLTPGLAKAAKNYAKFTKDLDRLNKKAYTSVSRTFSAMAQMAETLNDLPKAVAKATQRMGGRGGSGANKPLKVNVQVTLKGGKGLDKEIASAVLAGVRGASRRMPRGGTTSSAPAMAAPIGSSYTPQKFDIRAWQARKNAEAAAAVAARRQGVNPAMQNYKNAVAAAGKAAGGRGAGAARQSLLEAYAALPPAERKKIGGEYTKIMQTLRQSRDHIREADKSAGMMGRSLGFLQRGWSVVSGSVSNMASSAREIARNTRFTSIVTALDRFSGLFQSGHQFFQGMNELNKELHLSRAQLAEMDKGAIAIADKYSGLMDQNTVKDAMLSLAKFGARAREEFEKLAPTVALATQAMNISGDTAAQLARGLGSKFKMSGSQVSDVFANISRIGGATGVSGEDLARSMIDNTSAAGAFLKGLSPEGRQSVLTNMASLQGVLTKNFGDSGNRMGSMIAEALADASSDSARNVANLTGMTGGSGGSLGAALQKGDLSTILSNMAARGRQAGGNATVASQMAASMGISGADLIQFAQGSDDMQKDLQALGASAVMAGQGFNRLAEDAGKALSDIDKLKNKLKTAVADILPAWMLQGMSELSTSGTGIAAGGFLAGAGARMLGKVPVLGGLLRSIPGVGGFFNAPAAAAATNTARAGVGAAGLMSGASRAGALRAVGSGSLAMIPGLMAGVVHDKVMNDANSDLASGGLANISQIMSGRRNIRPGFIERGAMMTGNMDLSAADDQHAYRVQELVGSLNQTLPMNTPNRAQAIGAIEMAAWTNPERVPEMLRALYPAMAKQQMDEAAAAKEAAGRADMQRWQMMAGMGGYMMMPGAMTPPANASAPPRPLPPDQVTRAVAEGRY